MGCINSTNRSATEISRKIDEQIKAECSKNAHGREAKLLLLGINTFQSSQLEICRVWKCV